MTTGQRPTLYPGAPGNTGPYQVIGVLGRGGMGVVYLGLDPTTGERVAIKTVRAASGGMLSSIRREIHALRRIRHPGIVRILDQGIAEGLPWYAMELLEGRTLRDHIAELWTGPSAWSPLEGASTPVASDAPPLALGDMATLALTEAGGAVAIPGGGGERAPHRVLSWPLPPVLTLLRRLCSTLAFLHGQGIIHRDLKPSNVYIRPSGMPVVMDFGIAATFGGSRGREVIDVAGGMVGTSLYMAPEQIRGELVDARTDLYALGCIFYEVLTGLPPFWSDKQSVFESHLRARPLPPSQHVSGIPEGLEALVLRMLEKRPQDRPGYADDVAQALIELGAGERDPIELPQAQPYLYRPELAGRGALLGHLIAAVEEGQTKHRGARIFIGGESGVGKTRLVMEMTKVATQQHLAVVTAECMPLDVAGEGGVRAAPLAVFRPLLHAVVDHCREQGPAESERLLGPGGKILAAHEPSIAELPGQREQPEPPPLPAQAARARLFEAFKAMLFAFVEGRPLMLVLDDLQWADELSLSLLQALQAAAPEERGLLLVGTYRIEERGKTLREVVQAPGALHFELERLDAATVGEMVSGMLALREPPRAFVELLAHRSSGNPFFVGEYLQAAIGAGILRRNLKGEWLLAEHEAASAAALPLPDTLAELIDRRLKDLDERSRAFLAAACVLGREFELDLWLAVTQAAAEDVSALETVETLRQRQILEESEPGRIRFVHDKLRELSSERVPAAHAEALHLRAAHALEARYEAAADFAAYYPTLAHHYAKARVHDQASRYFQRAAERARAAYANAEAIALYQSALAEVRQLAEVDAAAAERWRPTLAQLHESLGDMLALTGQQQQARAALDQAITCQKEGEPIVRARLWRKVGKSWETHHEHEAALAAYGRAERALDEVTAEAEKASPWWNEWVQIQIDCIWVHYWRAGVADMTALIERVRPILLEHASPLGRAQFYQALVTMDFRSYLYRVPAETVAQARAAVAAAEEAGDVSETSMARFVLAFALLFHDALDEAEEEMAAGLAAARRIGDVTLQSRCLTYLSVIHRRQGRPEVTCTVGERALAAALAGGMKDYIGAARANLAWAAWRDGDGERAEKELGEALAVWQQLSPVYPYPFQWLARLLRLTLEVDAQRLEAAVAEARALLAPTQQRLPGELTACIERSIAAWERGALEEVRAGLRALVDLARRTGYL